MKTTNLKTAVISLLLATALPMSSYGQSSEKHASVNDGVDAYIKGDYKRAFEIWSHFTTYYPWGGTKDEQYNNDQARTNLGALYYLGKGTYQSDYMAAYWHHNAAKRGHSGGLHNVGKMYEEGKSVFKDPYVALQLYEKAAKKGNEDAAKDLAKLKAKMAGKLTRTLTQPIIWKTPTTDGEAGGMARAYAEKSGYPVILFQLTPQNFTKKIDTTYVKFIDTSSIKNVRIKDKTYKRVIVSDQYFKPQKLGDMTNRSIKLIELYDCAGKANTILAWQAFVGNEHTGKSKIMRHKYHPDIKLKPHTPGTVGYEMVRFVCDAEYAYTPK